MVFMPVCYFCLVVGLSVNRIAQILLDRFPQNLDGGLVSAQITFGEHLDKRDDSEFFFLMSVRVTALLTSTALSTIYLLCHCCMTPLLFTLLTLSIQTKSCDHNATTPPPPPNFLIHTTPYNSPYITPGI